MRMVGASRFELPTSRTPSECANQAALRSDIRCLRNRTKVNVGKHLKNSRENFKQILDVPAYLANNGSGSGRTDHLLLFLA